MFEELLKQWANEQGFDGWSRDHAAVLRNLVKWLNIHAAQQNAHLTPESLASSQAVSNASAISQSDGDTPPAQTQVA